MLGKAKQVHHSTPRRTLPTSLGCPICRIRYRLKDTPPTNRQHFAFGHCHCNNSLVDWLTVRSLRRIRYSFTISFIVVCWGYLRLQCYLSVDCSSDPRHDTAKPATDQQVDAHGAWKRVDQTKSSTPAYGLEANFSRFVDGAIVIGFFLSDIQWPSGVAPASP